MTVPANITIIVTGSADPIVVTPIVSGSMEASTAAGTLFATYASTASLSILTETTTSISASHAVNADSAISTSYADFAATIPTDYTASYAVYAETASLAATASFSETSSFSISSSFAETALTADVVEYDNVANKPTLISSSAQIIDVLDAEAVVSGGADVNLNNISASSVHFADSLRVEGTGSFAFLEYVFITSSVVELTGSTKFGDSADDVHQRTGSMEITEGGFTGSFQGDGAQITGVISTSHALQADSASLADNAISASFAPSAVSASHALNADSAISASFATTSSFAASASSAPQAQTAESASFATTASFASTTAPREYLQAGMTADQTANLTDGNHIQFNLSRGGYNIPMTSGSGQLAGIFTLAPNKTYRLQAEAGFTFGSASGLARFRWYNITAASLVGSAARVRPRTDTSDASNQPIAGAVISPTVSTEVEVRFPGGNSNITSVRSGSVEAWIQEV